MTAEEKKLNQLQQENLQLKEELRTFQDLKEDLAAKRIYDLAVKRIQNLVTFGGIITLLAGFIGYQTVIKYMKDQAQVAASHMDSATVTKLALKEIYQQVHLIGSQTLSVSVKKFENSMDSIRPYIVAQITSQIKVATQPLTTIGNSTSTTNPIANVSILPPATDLTRDMPGVNDQGPEGSVAAMALATTEEATIFIQKGERVRLSPRYIYKNIKSCPTGDCGATLSDGLMFLQKTGDVTENAWPYIPLQYDAAPPAGIASAKHYKITGFLRLNIPSIDAIKKYLVARKPVIVGVTMYKAFTSGNAAKTGVFPSSQPLDQTLGGHAVVIVGYDDNSTLFKFQNSWGTTWGDRGYGYMHYSDVNKLVGESYIITGVQ